MDAEEVSKKHQETNPAPEIEQKNKPNLVQIMKEAITRINPRGGITQKEMVAFINGKLDIDPTIIRQKIKKVLRTSNTIVQNNSTRLVVRSKICCDMVRPKPCIKNVKWRPKIPKMYNQKRGISKTERRRSYVIRRTYDTERRCCKHHHHHHHCTKDSREVHREEPKKQKHTAVYSQSSARSSESVPSEGVFYGPGSYEDMPFEDAASESSPTEVTESKSTTSEVGRYEEVARSEGEISEQNQY